MYVNGTTTSSGGGGSVTPTLGTRNNGKPNPTFHSWVAAFLVGHFQCLIVFKSLKFQEICSVAMGYSFEKDFDHFEFTCRCEPRVSNCSKLYGKGGLEINTPRFSDSHPLKGKNYYRLKSIDLDGRFEYSPVINAEWNFARPAVAYPNPVVDHDLQLNSMLTRMRRPGSRLSI